MQRSAHLVWQYIQDLNFLNIGVPRTSGDRDNCKLLRLAHNKISRDYHSHPSEIA